jgi:GNAT superfamily N-acetyltransferase
MAAWLRFAELALYFYPLDRGSLPLEDPEEGAVAFLQRTSTEQEIEPLASLLDPFLVRERLAKGEICCVIFQGARVLSFCWMAFEQKDVGEIEQRVKLAHGDVYLYQAYTVPKFRRKNLYATVLTHIIEFAKERSYKRLLIFSLAQNRFSRRGILRAGFTHFQTIFFFRVLTRKFYFSRQIGRHDHSLVLEPR